jgi:hypothetical protein
MLQPKIAIFDRGADQRLRQGPRRQPERRFVGAWRPCPRGEKAVLHDGHREAGRPGAPLETGVGRWDVRRRPEK